MPLKPLTESDAKHLLAAEGWLELGNFLAANEELENIAPLFRAHPEVLELRVSILMAGKKWDDALVIAETLTDQLPGRPAAWVAMAECLHQKGETESAYQTLMGIADEFTRHAEITYALARYAALVGEFKEAEEWLKLAFEAGGPKLKLKALDDPALKEFWEKIGGTRK